MKRFFKLKRDGTSVRAWLLSKRNMSRFALYKQQWWENMRKKREE